MVRGVEGGAGMGSLPIAIGVAVAPFVAMLGMLEIGCRGPLAARPRAVARGNRMRYE